MKDRMILTVLLLFSIPSFGQEVKESEEEVVQNSAPEMKRQGIYGTLFGDPGINFLGVNYAYWTHPQLRLSAGVGTIFFANTIGVGLNYYLSDAGVNRPYVGVGVNALVLDTFHDSAIYGDVSSTFIYENVKVGIEFGGANGLFFDAHLGAFFFPSSHSDRTFFFDPIPSLALGVYF